MLSLLLSDVYVLFPLKAKEVLELVGESQSTFRDMVSELGLSAAMKPETEYTLLAPLNTAFSGEYTRLAPTTQLSLASASIGSLNPTFSGECLYWLPSTYMAHNNPFSTRA